LNAAAAGKGPLVSLCALSGTNKPGERVPTIYGLKPRFQGLLRPITAALARAGVTANQVTVAAILLSLGQGLLIVWRPETSWPLLLLPFVLFLRMALNAIDGMLAREYAMKSRLGAVLNELGDVVSDAALYLPLALVPGMSAPLMVLIVLCAVIAEMAGVVAVQIGGERRYDGPLGKSDRALAFGALALLLGLGVPPGLWLDVVLAAMLTLAAWTVLKRSRAGLRQADQ
jgi:CDP-diacylglycerol---glycerol-3-phosphate 3-phosphatidyltransferase